MQTSTLSMVLDRTTRKNALGACIFNIEAFSQIPREGLEFGIVERRLLLHTTATNEKLYIQYPGKETKSSNPDNARPWDFRPKLVLPNGEEFKDLSFADIWDDLAELHVADEDALSVLAAIFFRMAIMADHNQLTESYSYDEISVADSKCLRTDTESLTWHKYGLNPALLNELAQRIPLIRGATLEAYLLYNDLLVQNEDCKYFYRAEKVNNANWDGKVGRYNTLLSHLSVIEFLKGEAKFSEIMNRFQRGRGVAPIPVGRIESVTNGIIRKR